MPPRGPPGRLEEANIIDFPEPELTRRLGEARGVFRALLRCWAHANITRGRKLELYSAIVLPRLLYNLETLWLLKADRKRLYSFNAQCLRRICRIPHSFLSRVSNDQILNRCRARPLSEALRERQTSMYNKIAGLSQDHPLRVLTCQPGSSLPRIWDQCRKRGRPKQQWASCVYKLVPQQ